MVFSLKERHQKMSEELRKEWELEIRNTLKLIVAGIDKRLIVTKLDGQGVAYQILSPREDEGTESVAAIKIIDSDNDCVIFQLIGARQKELNSFVFPLKQSEFIEALKVITTHYFDSPY